MASIRHLGSRIVASKLASHVPEGGRARSAFRVLDVAAGTGRVGEQLHKLGFRNIEALGTKSSRVFF